MEKHHVDSIANLVREFETKPEVSALILGGSLAHGFAKPDSDIDVAIVVSAAEFARCRQGGRLHYNNRELCTYPGYIDGKYMDVDFLRLVAARGSDPARYAFQDARVLFSRIDGLEGLLADIVRYPVAEKHDRIARFAAQLLGWRWYYTEGVRQQNNYLTGLALQKVVLFACRIVLADNELLFPYHKWMLRVTQNAPRQPPGLAAQIDQIMTAPTWERVNGFCLGILAFAGLDHDQVNASWPTFFMRDTELRWMTGDPSIDDL